MKKLLGICSRHRVFTRAISMLLAILLTFYVIPTVIYAEIADAFSNIGDSTAGEEEITAREEEDEIYEDVSRREESVKHFRLSDGTYVAAQYPHPVHYTNEDGEYEDIDNTLSEASGGVYATPNARIKFAKKITGNGELFTLHDGNTKLRMSLIGAKGGVAGVVANGEDAEEATVLQKMMNLEKLVSRILYEDILDGVDVEYVAESLTVKENIIVKERKDSYSYSFELKLNGLTAALSDNGDVEIFVSGTNEIKYVIPAPVVYDADGTHAPEGVAYYTLADGGNGKYTLTVTVSSGWMNAEERAFPVTVDPTVGVPQSQIVDTYVSSDYPNASYSSAIRMYADAKRHAYWRVSGTSLPSVPSYAYLIKAEIQLFGGGDDALVGAYLVTSDWDSTLTWNKTVSEDPQGALGTAVQSYNIVSNGYSWYTWDVTDAVRAWYSGDNYGIGFRLMDGSDNTKVASFHTANESYSKPVLSITYRDMKGVESYWPYSSHSAGTAGVGSINLATGQLSLAIPTLTTTTGIMPYTVSLVYNSGLAGKDHNSANSNIAYSTSYMPYGFKLNICETVAHKSYISATGETKATYIYTDADGTEHYLYPAGSDDTCRYYADEDGLGLELAIDVDLNVKITDKTKTVRRFSSIASNKWYLSSIEDVSGNAIVFTVDSAYRPTEISLDPAGSEPPIELLELWYNSDGKLVMIYNRSSKEAAVLRYSAVYDGDLVTSDTKYLRSIDFAHGDSYVTDSFWNLFITSRSNTYSLTLDSYSTYNYSSTGYIWQYRNTSADTYIEYILSSGRYTGVAERSQSNNDVGQSLRLFYGNGYTDVLSSGSDDISGSSDDIVTRYVMDPHGRAVSIYSSSVDGSDIYGATMGVYDSGEESKNSLKQQTALGGVSVNYLVNGGFESEIVSTLNWGMAGTAERFSDDSQIKDGDYAMDLSPTLGATARIYQTVTLTEGDYTLSFPYLTHYCDGTDVVVSISGYGVSYTENIGKNPNNSNGVQSFFSTTFTVPTTASYMVTILATAQSVGTYAPVVNIDNVMLSKGVGASDYTMVTYGSMEESGGMARSTVWTGSGFEFAESANPFDTTIKVTATTTGESYAKQRIYTAPAAYLSAFDINPTNVNNAVSRYLVSGFAKAENAVLGNPDGFSIRLDVAYYQGSGNDDEIVTHRVTFIPSVTEWQFATAEFSTALEYDMENDINYRCIRYIDLVCEYSYQQAGTVAYFDNVSVIKNIDNSESYSYDANGNVAIIKGAHYSEYYVYDENNNLITSANTLGNMVEYTYTSAGLVSTETVSYVSGAMSKIYEEYAAGTVVGTPKSRTSYTYDIYGLTAMVETIELSSSGTQAANTYPIKYTYTYNTSSGSKIFGILASESESGGATTRYFYNSSNGRLNAVVNVTDGNGYAYTYDATGKLIGVRPATATATSSLYTTNTSSERVIYTYDAADRLSTITTASTTYTLTYDVFGKAASVKAGDNTLATYIYNQFNGKLNTIVYGNVYAEEYVYDTLENISEIWYTVGGVKTLAYSYEYNADGSVYKIIDHVNGTETVHKYDLSGRVIAVNRYDVTDKDHDLSSSITYDDSGRVDQIK